VDVSQLNTGEKAAGGAGLLLLISMFLPWYGIDTGFGSVNASAWEIFSYTDLVLFVAGVAGVAVAVLSLQNRLAALPVPAGQLLLGLGGLALLLVLFRTINPPGPGEADLGRKLGLFIGLIAAAGVTYAGKLVSDEPGVVPPPPPPPAPRAPGPPPA